MKLIITFLLSLVPSYEARYAIPTSLAFTGLDPLFIYVVCVLLNLAVIPIVFFGLDLFAPYFREKFDWVDSIFVWFKERGEGRSWEIPALILFVSTPIPGTGAYTGALMAYLFKLDRVRSAIAISIGVVISATLTTLTALGIISLSKFFL